MLATASKTYDGSVLFRTSAYTGAKQASKVPFWFRDLSRQNRLVPGQLVRVISYHFSGHLVPSFMMGFKFINAILLCVKIYVLNRLLDKKITFDQMHIGKSYHISCNTVLCILFNSMNLLCLYVCIYTNIIIIIL